MSVSASPTTAEAVLVPTRPHGEWAGLGNLLRMEFGRWWKTRRWWIHSMIWGVLVAGISAIVLADSDGMAATEHITESVLTFFGLAIIAVGLGIVVSVQGSVVGEKEQGTAAWLLSKPVSRTSFLVAKLVAETTGFVVTGVLLPAAGFLLATSVLLPEPLDIGRFLIALWVPVVAVMFYVTLTVSLGAVFSSRGPVAGIGVGLILAGQVLRGLLPGELVIRTPWALPEAATALALPTSSLGWSPLTPVLVTVGLTLALGVIGVWRFRREEF